MSARNTPLEILAPAGNEEMLRAAVYSGADAVYLGFSGFNARKSAGNFTAETLKDAVAFCHGRGVRVHVALNTTVYPGEVQDLAGAIRAVAAAGADAVILQDMATAALAKRVAPGLELHGSTQMSVHSLAGVKELARLGFSRAILSRELSGREIARIAAESPIELECFIHGALCMSVSGQCYMSAFLGGRSGNRGSCAGTCRLPFAADGAKEGYHLSLKDLSLVDKIPELMEAGVVSVKNEGRLRTPEYVAAAVAACRAAREQKPYDKQLLENAFSRSGFTSGWYDGKIDGTMFGVRTQEDTAASKAALPGLRELYRREYSRIPVQFALCAKPDGLELTADDGQGHTASAVSRSQPQPAKTDQRPGIERALGKTGGTPFVFGGLTVEGEPGYLPGSEWNELRRILLEDLLAQREKLTPIPCTGVQPKPPVRRTVPVHPGLRARFERWGQVPPEWAEKLGGITLPIAQAGEVPAELRHKVTLELPRVMFGVLEADTRRRMEEADDLGFAAFEAGNLAHLELGRGLATPMTGGFGLNITNHLAARQYAALGLKSLVILPEVTAADMAYIAPGVPSGAVIYGHMPLMITRACPLHNRHTCQSCNGRGTLTDRKNKVFQVRCGLGVRTIYNPVPIYMGDKPGALPVDFGLAYFTLENPQRAAQVLEMIANRTPFDREFTRGLYFKGTA